MVYSMRRESVTAVRTLEFGKGPDGKLLTLESTTGLGSASLVI